MADQPELDWSAAEVSHGTLSVEVSGDPDEEWGQTFARTLALLSSGGDWGAVGFQSGTVTVEDVPEGSEDNLRFALDGAVQEANAHHAADDGGEPDPPEDQESAGEDSDRRMTDRFRDAP